MTAMVNRSEDNGRFSKMSIPATQKDLFSHAFSSRKRRRHRTGRGEQPPPKQPQLRREKERTETEIGPLKEKLEQERGSPGRDQGHPGSRSLTSRTRRRKEVNGTQLEEGRTEEAATEEEPEEEEEGTEAGGGGGLAEETPLSPRSRNTWTPRPVDHPGSTFKSKA